MLQPIVNDEIKILYVDDEQANIDYFKTVFRKEYKILSARSGESALQLLKDEGDVNIILTDQKMGKMTGIEFLRSSMEVSRDSARVLVTGYADMETVISAINQGHIFYYIPKPWSYGEMKVVIGRAVENFRLNKINKELLIRSERQEKEKVITELESLRNHVNPHFLFNSLNTLRALVHGNEPARDFISKLSGIYRHMLEHSSTNVVLLSEEMSFCEDYFGLQRVRFQEALVFEKSIEDHLLKAEIPSASLQILIENTVKHNIVTAHKPLKVQIYSEEGWLIVKNNYQPRKQVSSTQMGQSNILRRYSYLTDLVPEFYAEDGFYYAKIPVLVNKP